MSLTNEWRVATKEEVTFSIGRTKLLEIRDAATALQAFAREMGEWCLGPVVPIGKLSLRSPMELGLKISGKAPGKMC